MSITVEAVYEQGVLKPNKPLPFKEHESLRVTVEPALCEAEASAKCATDLARLLAHAGAVDLGRPTGANNESIDADLAREYGSCRGDSR